MKRIFESKVFGAKKITPTVVLKGSGTARPAYEFTVNEAKGTAMLRATQDGIFCDTLFFTYDEKRVLCRRVFENLSADTLELCELGFEIKGICFDGNSEDDYFYSNENERIYGQYTLPVDFDRSVPGADNSEAGICFDCSRADPGTICERIGASPYQPFPAVLVSNYGVKEGIVHGTLSQDVFYHNYLVKHEDNALNFYIFSSFKGIDALCMQPGRVIVDEWYLGRTDAADDICAIFEDYTDELRKKLPCAYGRTDINRTSMIWGSWNDGVFRDINEDIMLEEAKFVSAHFPTVNWIQLDDGYGVYSKKLAHGLGVPYEGEAGVDAKKFPRGFRSMTDYIRTLGVRPAIWIGGFVPHEAPLYQEHPDWFLDYSFRVDTTSPLDVSQPQVQAYMLSALDTFFGKYGFEGVKHDFWSYAFEDSHDLLKYKDRSGYELRRWWLTQMRSRLGKAAHMQTGCDICMGNPFLGEFFSNYRYGPDVLSGNWNNVKCIFLLGAGVFSTHAGDLFPPNSDSVGILAGLAEHERDLLIHYCMTTHSMVELGGKLSQFADKAKMKQLKKAVCNPNNGQDVYFVGFDYRCKTFTYPEILYFNTAHFTAEENNPLVPLRTVSFFNLDEKEKTYTVTAQDLKLPEGEYLLTDVWSGEVLALRDIELALPAHHSRMFAVSDQKQVLLTDANIRINTTAKCGEKLVLATDYAQPEAELTLTRAAKKITLNGVNVPFETIGEKTCFALEGKGMLEIEF